MFEHYEKQEPDQPMTFFEGLLDAGKQVYKSWQHATRPEVYDLNVQFALHHDTAMEEAYADIT